MSIQLETAGPGATLLPSAQEGSFDLRAAVREAECLRRGWYCKEAPGTGQVPCDAADPEGQPDLGRLYLEAAWERVLRGWVREA